LQTWIKPTPLPLVYLLCVWDAFGGNFPANRLEQDELREFQELERKIMHKILDDYLLICHHAAVCVFFNNSSFLSFQAVEFEFLFEYFVDAII